MSRQVVILAAGMGTRLGRPFPKPLTELSGGHSIMFQQISKLREAMPGIRITVVVGFKRDLIMEAFPDVLFAYNELYDQTNTSKSLLRALELSAEGGVLWLNGDVVFHVGILERVIPLMEQDSSFVCVNTAAVGDEEVKYTVDESGNIRDLSKRVTDPLGEAIGINFVSAKQKAMLISALRDVDDNDYFERGIEVAVAEDNAQFQPVDISDLYAVEVDFEEDLTRAKKFVDES
ncbi:MAG: NTP transferase domain-containing protein [Actinomycetia bacterium]|nr:NTP transferase domain-containing protein [Actinomycetes bacterium]MCH9801249.1 NTP transferase domain-containing protein [Actinomycetes bacterium]